MLLSSKIHTILGKNKVKQGDVGIEIEAEYQNPFSGESDRLSFWQIKGDGSLRNNGYEFVLTNPVKVDLLSKVLTEWKHFILKNRMKYIHSNRCSVHIHNNVQNFTVLETITAICCYWLVEPYLMAFCGESRKGNNFCLSLRDADAVHTQLIKNIKSGKFFEGFHNDGFRYSSLNPEAIQKFGSIEIRTMRGTDKIDEIEAWAKINHEIFSNSKQFKDPQDLMNKFNQHGPDYILRTLLSPASKTMLEYVNKGKKSAEMIEENALYILEVAEARDTWDIDLEQNEKKEIEKKVTNLKLEYLISIGFPNSSDTVETAKYLAQKELMTNHSFKREDFND